MDDQFDRTARARVECPFLSTPQAAFYLGLTTRRLERMRRAAKGPRFRRHSRYVFYHIDDLDAWSKETSTSGKGRG